MSLFFADEDNITFGVQGSNQVEVAQFSSTLDDVFMRLYTNNNSTVENITTAVVIGSSNYDKVGQANNLYFGHLTDCNVIQRVITMKDERVGINTDPTATLHIIGSNIPYSNIVQIESINSPAYPALNIDKYGYVGIGTQAVHAQELTVRGTIYADAIRIGGGEVGESKLITAYGMAPPAESNFLEFGNTTFCNVSEIVAPQVTAENLIETFKNIADSTFLNSALVSIGTISPAGSVPFTTTFKGNSTSFTYSLNVVNTGDSSTTTLGPRTINNTSSELYSSIFASGNYVVNITANTPGTGDGSTFSSNNIARFSVGATDSIAAPSVALSGSPVPSISTSNLVYVSGVPYYGNGTTITYPASSLSFSNIYNTIDPRTALTNVLTIRDATHNANATNYTYANLFTNVLLASSTNNNSVSLTLSSTTNPALTTLSATVYNINYQSGILNSSFQTQIAYLGTTVNESAMNVADFTGMPITSAIRQTVANGTASSLVPALGDMSTYSGTPSQYDCFYYPYNGGVFYSSAASLSRGNYAPSYSAPAGAHQNLTFLLATNTTVNAFVLNFTGAVGISNVYIQWQSVGSWYNAKVLYTSGGCAASTYSSGTRFPILLPQGQTLSTNTNIYVNVEFSGSIPLSGITVTNT